MMIAKRGKVPITDEYDDKYLIPLMFFCIVHVDACLNILLKGLGCLADTR